MTMSPIDNLCVHDWENLNNSAEAETFLNSDVRDSQLLQKLDCSS